MHYLLCIFIFKYANARHETKINKNENYVYSLVMKSNSLHGINAFGFDPQGIIMMRKRTLAQLWLECTSH